jgi:hypothetical protein
VELNDTASARPLVDVLGVDEGGVNTTHLPRGMRRPPKEDITVIELCRDDGAGAAPMNKSTAFLVDKKENTWVRYYEAWVALAYTVSWPRVSRP